MSRASQMGQSIKELTVEKKGELADVTKNIAAVQKKRASAVIEGKNILKDGGDAARAILQAKKIGTQASGVDAVALQASQDAYQEMMQAAAQLRFVAAGPELPGVGGKENFLALAESYEKRAAIHQQIIQLLSASRVVPKPQTSVVEKDAMKIMVVKDLVSNPRQSLKKAASGTFDTVDAPSQRRMSIKAAQEQAAAITGQAQAAASSTGEAPAGENPFAEKPAGQTPAGENNA